MFEYLAYGFRRPRSRRSPTTPGRRAEGEPEERVQGRHRRPRRVGEALADEDVPLEARQVPGAAERAARADGRGRRAARSGELRPSAEDVPTVHLKNPTAADKTVAGLKTKMQADPTCQASLPVPDVGAVRQGGLRQVLRLLQVDAGGRQGQGRGCRRSTGTGTRHEYVLLIPVTNPIDRGKPDLQLLPARAAAPRSARDRDQRRRHGALLPDAVTELR